MCKLLYLNAACTLHIFKLRCCKRKLFSMVQWYMYGKVCMYVLYVHRPLAELHCTVDKYFFEPGFKGC